MVMILEASLLFNTEEKWGFADEQYLVVAL